MSTRAGSTSEDADGRLRLREHAPEALGLDAAALARLVAECGPLAVVDLETTGLSSDPEAEILEFGAVLVDPGAERVRTAEALLRPRHPLPRAVKRLTGLADEDVAGAPALAELAGALAELLAGRTLVAHNAPFERHFLRGVDAALGGTRYLDTLDLLALTHPDAPDLRLESFTRLLLGTEEHHRALGDALDTARVISKAGAGAVCGEARFATARRALEGFAPDSPWLALLAKPEEAPAEGADAGTVFVRVGESGEAPVPFEEEAIAAALGDEARGRRAFPGYRARAEQIRLARSFARNLRDEEVLLAEGGTGVGKSLAYLAAAIPFAMERAAKAEAGPVVIATRTKLLQDQLLTKDIPAAARFLGHPGLRAVAIKGRANYVCARRLEGALAEGREPRIFAEDRLAYAVLESCAHTRPHGEVGSVPAAMLRRYPPLRPLLRRSVAPRAELCSREQCARRPDCALGRLRTALARAHLVVANHDLLLRWPSDYPAFSHVIADEAHEMADVADEVYAMEVRPEEVLERVDELFGRPDAKGASRGDGLLPWRERRRLERDARFHRRSLVQELTALGRALGDRAGEFGEVQVPDPPGPGFEDAAELARGAADRLDATADFVPEVESPELRAGVERGRSELRRAAEALRLAFADTRPDAVSAFEGLLPPWDRWRLVVRPVSPAPAFEEHFLSRCRSFAGVSASLFVGGDAFAALGDLELEERAGERLRRVQEPSPFPYERHMRVVALDGGGALVEETADVLERLARALGGRTLGLFTSLRRMLDVGDVLAGRLREEGIDVLTPRGGRDDPAALVARFVGGAAVLLGARRFWQGIDVPGESLQAVVIEKLPFEVPTELRRRRIRRLEERGVRAFERYTLGRMLLSLKQMVGRLIRTEEDRGVVVIVEGRTEKGYFRRLSEALPPGCTVSVSRPEALPAVLHEVGIGSAAAMGDERPSLQR